MTTEVEHNKKRKYFPILINGKIKYIRDRKDYRIKKVNCIMKLNNRI